VDKILAAALDMVDREGLEALTMRRLAEELRTNHTSLYRHVASREELVVLLVDHVLGDIRPPASAKRWRDRAASQAREYRRVLLEHPALVPAFTAGQLLGPKAMRVREAGLRLLCDEGADPTLAAHAHLLIAHFVIGSALLDTGGAARTVAVRKAMTGLFKAMPADQFPTVLALAEIFNDPDSDAEFEFGLRAVLDGIERHLPPNPKQ
jgi:AcrR family transcriptional regulator